MAQSPRGMHKSVHSAEQEALRRLLVEARTKAKLTQMQLSKRLKKPQSFVAKYEVIWPLFEPDT
jgi:ribosome-binding protein aMBF1 (putative translation factor)